MDERTRLMTPEQRRQYIRELREWILWCRKEWGLVPKHTRVAIMSHARHAATGPHAVWEPETT